MDSKFAFPSSQRPIPRTRPLNTSPQSRESNALRASVLDAALELGIGNNSLVATWMFDNTLKEEDENEEEEPISSPGLTNGFSTASDEGPSSSRYPQTPPELGLSPSLAPNNFQVGKPIAGWEPSDIPFPTSGPGVPGGVSFTELPIPVRPTTPNGPKKLRKKTRDGYESDGGYLSEDAKKVQKKEEKARLKEEKREQKEEERKRKKSLGAKAKGSKKTDDSGYETDGVAVTSSSKSPFKSKSKKSKAKDEGSAGYETDAGYASTGSGLKKPKTRFFKLSLKSSRSDLKADAAEQMPPPLPKEPMTLPIAERFASSVGGPGSPTQRPSSPEARPSTQSSPFQLPGPGSPIELPSIAMSPPISLDHVARPPRNPPPTRPIPPIDRTSLSSADSSSSSGAYRPLVPRFASSQEASAGHGITASVSTLNSSSHGSNGHAMHPHPISPTSPPKDARPTSPNSATGSSSLSISFPLTRGATPIPPPAPVAPWNMPKSHPHTLPQLDVHSRNQSPLPLSPNSPYVLVTPSASDNPSPVQPNSNIPPPPSFTSPPHTASPIPPRSTPIDGYGPRLTSPPPNLSGRLSPNPAIRGRRLPPLLAPEGHPDVTPLPSPNVLAYYDIPPPSPPPMGPLPSVPAGAPPAPPSQLRAKVLERQRNGSELASNLYVPQSNIQRGRESPFPTKPVTSPPGQPMPPSAHVQHVPGLEARARLARLRDGRPISPAVPIPISRPGQSLSPTSRHPLPPASEVREVYGQWDQGQAQTSLQRNSQESDRSDSNEMQPVLARFAESSEEGVSIDHAGDGTRPLVSKRSFEALGEKHESFAVSQYYGARDTMYGWEEDGTGNNRESRWSGSIYSRISILDEDKSGETRDRFVKKVEAMMKAKEKNEAVPPVPTIAEGLANARSWNKF